jgi:hypothetical protein
LRDLGSFHHYSDKGNGNIEKPQDPLMIYDKLLNDLFEDYKFVDKKESTPSNLFVSIPSGETIPFQDLSSGEKEVFFILSFFLRHDVTNSVIVIDEPELHLHPELARLLIRQILKIKKGNQIWIATHNSEIIDEAERDKVFYVTRDKELKKSKVTSGVDEENSLKILRDFFGYSGYIGIAKKLVFLEGNNSSIDRKYLTTLFPESNSKIKFIPSSSSGNLAKINSAILSILESNLGWLDFYLIRDRDYLSQEMVEKYKNHKSGKLHVLDRHEIENYLINEKVIAKILADYYNINKTIPEIELLFKRICQKMSGSVLRDAVTFRMNLLFQPEDFSIGSLLTNQSIFENDDSFKVEKIEIIKTNLNKKVSDINKDLAERTKENELRKIIDEISLEIKASLENGAWKSFFPGKELLINFAKELGIKDELAFQNILIKELRSDTNEIPNDLIDVMKKIIN